MKGTTSQRGSIELIAVGLLAALILVLALPVFDLPQDVPAVRNSTLEPK